MTTELSCNCLCHLGVNPKKGEIKKHLGEGVDAIDPVAIATACSRCAQRHAECVEGMRVCSCGHKKWKHIGVHGCAGTFAERCHCAAFQPQASERVS